MNEELLLKIRDLRVAYEGGGLFGQLKTEVVHGVSLHIAEGETLGLVGESGSGKSTIGRAILRLLRPSSGSITFNGKDVMQMGRRTPLWYRRAVQAVFQDPAASLNPLHSVSKALSDALYRHGVRDDADRKRRILEVFDRVGLKPEHLRRYPSELSGGQQQRVAIARALVLEPRLVVCDEAVSALDLSTQSQILDLLAELQDSLGVSYLFIAHDLGIVRHLCDRIAVMSKGEIVETAESEALFNNPQAAYTRRLLGATPASSPEGRDERRAKRAQFRAQRAAQGTLEDA